MNLGRYKVLEELGRGSFGIVYKAEDQALDRVVALKVLHNQLTVDPGFIGRFEQEAKLAARLDHPNLVPIYDLGQIDGLFFIAMGLMAGGSLKDRLKKEGAFGSEKARDVFSQILQGVQVIHENNIIHRDLKPGNILFDQYGIARISDLGFAKALHSDASTSLSMSGGMIGTPAYMAPEIWEGKPAGPASDIYSLGCVLYEILTGKVLFDGESAAEVMTKHIIHGPKLETRALPLFWKNILGQCLAQKAQNRYQSVQQILDDLMNETSSKSVSDSLSDPRTAETASSSEDKLTEQYLVEPAIELEETEPYIDSYEAQVAMNEGRLLPSSDAEPLTGDVPQLEPEKRELKEQEDLSAFIEIPQRPEEGVKPDDNKKPWLIPLLVGIGLVMIVLVLIVLVLILATRPKQPTNIYSEPLEIYNETAEVYSNTTHDDFMVETVTDKNGLLTRQTSFPIKHPQEVINLTNVDKMEQIGIIGKGEIGGISLSSDHSLLAVGTGAGIYILDAGDLSLVNHIATELDLCDLVFLPDSHLVLANESWSVSLWDADTGEMKEYFIPDTALQGEIATSEDGSKISIGTYNNWEIYDFNLTTGECGEEIENHYSWTGAEDSEFLYEYDDNKLKMVDKGTNNTVAVVDGFFRLASGANSSPDGTILFGSHYGGAMRIWDFQNGTLLKEVFPFDHFLSDNSEIFDCLLEEAFLKNFSVDDFKNNMASRFDSIPIDFYSCDISPDGHTGAVGTYEGEVYLFDLDDTDFMVFLGNQNHLVTEEDETQYISDIVFSPDGKLVAAGSFDQSVTVWDVQSHEKIHEFKFGLYNGELAFSPDSKLLAAAGFEFGIWDLSTGQSVFSASSIRSPENVVFSPAGDVLAVGLMWRNIVLLDPTSGRILRILDQGIDEFNYDITFSNDGKMLITAGGNGIIRIWGIP